MPYSNPDYNKIAGFYDHVIGSDVFGSLIKDYLEKYYKKGSDILELGCGTAINLKSLFPFYNVEGIDISDKMLSIARKKLPQVKFYRQNIKNFKVVKKYDAILCLYDTINHIKGLNNWSRIFRNVKKHLKESGVFIFDINTLYKLNFLHEEPASVIAFGKNFLIMNVVRKNSISKENIFSWNMRIFDKTSKNNYTLTEKSIMEYGYEVSSIIKDLNKYFKSVKVLNSDLRPAGKYSDRIFFICK
ncbi:class I SAM-dependent methyltransferase [soil metagenome]